jgi:NTE family protein
MYRMGWSRHTRPMETSARKRIAVACQGGGSHTSFTAGALKELLRRGHDKYDLVALSGTSGGAVCALLAWYALLQHGAGAGAAVQAGRSLEKFWLRDNAPTTLPERLLNDWLVAWLRWQSATGVLIEQSPNAMSDYWQDQLGRAVQDNVPFAELPGLVTPSSPRLFVGAVDVLTGAFKVFRSHRRASAGPGESWEADTDAETGISVDAILASAAIPPVFRGVRIGQSVYWDGLFSQNPPVRELLEAQPDEIWVIQINPNRMVPRPGEPVPGDEPTSVVDILDRRNALAGNLSLNQELSFVEKINELVEELGEDDGGGRRLRLERSGRTYRPVMVRRIEMSWPLGASSKLNRDPSFIGSMLRYGEHRVSELFTALDFEQAWTARDQDTLVGFFAPKARIGLTWPSRERTSYDGEEQVRDFVRNRLTGEVQVDLTRKQVAGETVTWNIQASPHLDARMDGGRAADWTKGTAEAQFDAGRIVTLDVDLTGSPATTDPRPVPPP